jgi:hypothetical protein
MTARRLSTPPPPGFRPPAPGGIERSHAMKAWRRPVCSERSRASAANGLAMKGFASGASAETDNDRYIKHLLGRRR